VDITGHITAIPMSITHDIVASNIAMITIGIRTTSGDGMADTSPVLDDATPMVGNGDNDDGARLVEASTILVGKVIIVVTMGALIVVGAEHGNGTTHDAVVAVVAVATIVGDADVTIDDDTTDADWHVLDATRVIPSGRNDDDGAVDDEGGTFAVEAATTIPWGDTITGIDDNDERRWCNELVEDVIVEVTFGVATVTGILVVGTADNGVGGRRRLVANVDGTTPATPTLDDDATAVTVGGTITPVSDKSPDLNDAEPRRLRNNCEYTSTGTSWPFADAATVAATTSLTNSRGTTTADSTSELDVAADVDDNDGSDDIVNELARDNDGDGDGDGDDDGACCGTRAGEGAESGEVMDGRRGWPNVRPLDNGILLDDDINGNANDDGGDGVNTFVVLILMIFDDVATNGCRLA
jgi:hypothetical protein